MPDDELLERVRELRARGRSPKEIARALKVRPATVTPLIRRLAGAEPQEKEAPLIGCWVNQDWSSSVRFTGHPEWPDTGAAETGGSGLVIVVVARERASSVRVCEFLVDTWCLGVKNALGPKQVERRKLLWFEWWFEELVQAAADRVKAEAAGDGDGWQAPWRLLHGLEAIGSPALRTAAMQAVKDAGRALTRQQSSAAPDWLGLCPEGSVTGGIWAMRDDYRTRFAVLAECGYPGGVDPHVFLLDIDACVAVTTADAAVFDSLDQAVAAWREGKGDTARTARPEPVTDYSQLGFLVCCDVSPNGPFRGDESRGYADNLFRANRRVHDIADAMAGRGHQWPDENGSHRDHAAMAEVMAKAFGDWYARRHGREPGGEAARWLAGDWVTGTLRGYENAVSPHRVRALLAYMDDDWLPEEPETVAAYELLPEWVRWNGEQIGVPGPLIERSVAVAERRQSDISDCPSFRFRPRPGGAP